MGFLNKKRSSAAAGTAQLRDAGRHPFSALDGYVPLKNGEIALYRAIREAVLNCHACSLWALKD